MLIQALDTLRDSSAAGPAQAAVGFHLTKRFFPQIKSQFLELRVIGKSHRLGKRGDGLRKVPSFRQRLAICIKKSGFSTKPGNLFAQKYGCITPLSLIPQALNQSVADWKIDRIFRQDLPIPSFCAFFLSNSNQTLSKRKSRGFLSPSRRLRNCRDRSECVQAIRYELLGRAIRRVQLPRPEPLRQFLDHRRPRHVSPSHPHPPCLI